MGHIGKKGILGADGLVGVDKGVGQQMLLLHFPFQLLIHPAGAYDNLGGTPSFSAAHVYHTQLKVPHLSAI